jgi:outer membrane protein assembly factor BamB
VTLDAEVRALERVAKARPDDGAAQVGLANALVRMGRGGEALEAFLRAAAAEPGDPEVARALAAADWWSGPRGPGGGARFVSVPGLRARPNLVRVARLGQGGVGIALGRGLIFARATEEGGDARLVALALATGRELWSHEERVAASAPPLVCEDTLVDAALVDEAGSVVFRVRGRDGVTGSERWGTALELSGVRPGAIFSGAWVSGKNVAFAISPHGKTDFEPIVRVLDATTGAPRTDGGFPLPKLSDVAFEGDTLYAATFQEPKRIVARTVDGVPVFKDALRGHRSQRLVVSGEHLLVATDDSIVRLNRKTGELMVSRVRRIAVHEALVVSPRLVIGSWQREGIVALDLRTLERVWSDVPPSRALQAAEDTIYSVEHESLVRALDLATGEPLWRVDVGRLALELDGGGIHKIAVAPSRLVGLTKEGVFFLLA